MNRPRSVSGAKTILIFSGFVLIGIGVWAGLPGSQTIFEAARKGDIAALKALLRANPELVNTRGQDGRSPLQEAIMAGQSEATKFLVEAGADVEWRDADGISPLGYACFAGNADLAALILERGAKVGPPDSALGGTPLHYAALRGYADLVLLLAEKGAPLEARTKDGWTALAMAVERGKRDCVAVLLSRGASADWRDEKNCTLLHKAVLTSDPEIVRLLLAGKADPLVRSAYGNTALDLARQDGLQEIAGLFSPGGAVAAPEFPSVSGPYLGQPPPDLAPRMFAPGIVSTERHELNSVFTPDGKEFYFTIQGASGRWTIMMTRLENGRWSRPGPASFSGRWSDVDLFITGDGRRLCFCSNRPIKGQGDAPKDFDIWMSERTGQGWSEPVNVGPPVNSRADEFYPSLTRDGTIYFQSRRPGGPGIPDIWRARRADSGFAPAECLPPPVNSAGFEGDTLVAPDESYLIVSAGREPGGRAADLYVSFPGPDGTWSPLAMIGFGVSSAGMGENCQMLSPDGRYLFFTRGGDIYWVDAAVIGKSRPVRQALPSKGRAGS